MIVTTSAPEQGDVIRILHIRSLDIEEIGVALSSFFQISPTPPQLFLKLELSVSLSSVLISAVKAGWMLHRRSASKGQSQCSLHGNDITATFSQLVYIWFSTLETSAIPSDQIQKNRTGQGLKDPMQQHHLHQ